MIIMIQYTETYRIKLSLQMKANLNVLKLKYNICPAKFIRTSIEEKLKRELPKLKESKNKVHCPF